MDDVVIFDGVCNLCARSVAFILRHEADPRLRFVPLQSTAGSRLMREIGLDPEDAKTFVLLAGGKACSCTWSSAPERERVRWRPRPSGIAR